MAGTKEGFFRDHALYLGIDVGKSFHWAFGVDASGEAVISRRLENRQAEFPPISFTGGVHAASGRLACVSSNSQGLM